jgi:hypothetical protein
MVESRSANSLSMYVPGALDMISSSVARVRDATRIDVGESVPPSIPSRADDGYVAQLTMPATAMAAAATVSARPGLEWGLRDRIVRRRGKEGGTIEAGTARAGTMLRGGGRAILPAVVPKVQTNNGSGEQPRKSRAEPSRSPVK